MTASTTASEKARRKTLNQLRARRGGPRRKPDTEKPAHQQAYFVPLLKSVGSAGRPVDISAEALNQLALDPQMHDLFTGLRTLRRGGPHPLDPGAPPAPTEAAPAPAAAPMDRGRLLQEIGVAHFRTNMQEWLGRKVTPDHDQSTATLADLQHLQQETKYRLKVLKAMVSMTENELDGLLVQIRARQAPEKS